MSDQPLVLVLGGPNGAGKSTSSSALRETYPGIHFVNADTIARGLSAFYPESVSILAGRVMLERLHSLSDAKVSFAFETALASRTFAPFISGLIENGYRFRLDYIWLRSPELAMKRVAQRVRRGGHQVPDETIRQRYYRGLNAFGH